MTTVPSIEEQQAELNRLAEALIQKREDDKVKARNYQNSRYKDDPEYREMKKRASRRSAAKRFFEDASDEEVQAVISNTYRARNFLDASDLYNIAKQFPTPMLEQFVSRLTLHLEERTAEPLPVAEPGNTEQPAPAPAPEGDNPKSFANIAKRAAKAAEQVNPYAELTYAEIEQTDYPDTDELRELFDARVEELEEGGLR